jgi:hypothetical protein
MYGYMMVISYNKIFEKNSKHIYEIYQFLKKKIKK